MPGLVFWSQHVIPIHHVIFVSEAKACFFGITNPCGEIIQDKSSSGLVSHPSDELESGDQPRDDFIDVREIIPILGLYLVIIPAEGPTFH